MYTKHGHHIPNSPDDSPHKHGPLSVAACGGINDCVDCAREAIPFLPINPQTQEVDPEFEKLLAEEEAEVSQGNAARQRYVDEFLRQDRSTLGEDEIRHRFGYHKATDITAPMHQAVRGLMIDVTLVLDRMLPNGRAKFQAMVDLEKAAMWANKAIAEMAPVVDE